MKEAWDLINDCEQESDGFQSSVTLCNVEKLMIEFAKLHVEAALEKVINNVEIIDYDEHEQYSPHVDEKSILNSYPLTLIK